MASDRGSDIIDLNLAVHLGKFLFDKIRNGSCILIAVGIADENLAGIIKSSLCTLFHDLNDTLDDFLLAPYFLTGYEFSFVIDVEKGADAKYGSDGSCGLADSSAPYVKSKIG